MTSRRIVVFDLDGTLVDTAPDLINALNFILAREGLAPVPLHAARNMIGAGARKLLERGLELEGRTVSLAELDRLTDDFINHYAEHIADASRPFDGLEAALDDLESSGYRFAVCTNKLEWLSKRLLDRLGLSARFAAICGADTFGISKPDPPLPPPRRHSGDRCRIRLYRRSNRRPQARPADRPYERAASRCGKPDASPATSL